MATIGIRRVPKTPTVQRVEFLFVFTVILLGNDMLASVSNIPSAKNAATPALVCWVVLLAIVFL
jgi:hypothetical protein